MRKTKILVTLGPAAEEENVLRSLIDAGMNVARLNFSHGDFVEHGTRVERIKKLREEMKKPVALLLDTKGPEIRAGEVENDKIFLEAGKKITITTEKVMGTPEILSISYDKLPSMLEPGNSILLDDGLIQLHVDRIINYQTVECTIMNNGSIKSKRGVNVPRLHLNLPNPTPKDRDDIRYAAENDFDFIAVSFAESEDTIRRVKAILDVEGKPNIKVIAKIENHAGLANFDSILEVADGIMVARGDLGVELLPEEVPIVQKEIIRRCYMAGKPVITATQMLHSMIESPRPTRAEVSDVANAIYDFTSAVMLSGETSVGKYPIECVKLLDRVAGNTEDAIDYKRIYSAFNNFEQLSDRTSAVTNAAITTAYNVGARAIITVTESGKTAQALSKLRPSIPIIAVVSNLKLYNQLSINWGITPVLGGKFNSIEELYRESIRLSRQTGIISDGDTVIMVAGLPVGRSGGTNMIKVETVGNAAKCPNRRKSDEASAALQFSLGQEKTSHSRLNQQSQSGSGPLSLLSRPIVSSPHRHHSQG
ncbi:MAG: pyruvate kinase [Candidatus Riflebacteria bacterium]